MPTILSTIPKDILHTITGNMLGDGHIRSGSTTINGERKGNARYGMTVKAINKAYLEHLYFDIYKVFGAGSFSPYPKLGSGLPVAQYHFDTLSSPILTILHELWYK